MGNSITKPDLLRIVSTYSGVPASEVEKVLDSFSNTVASYVRAGWEVPYPALGKFVPHDRRARNARNPATGGTVAVPPKRVVKFKPSVSMTRLVSGE